MVCAPQMSHWGLLLESWSKRNSWRAGSPVLYPQKMSMWTGICVRKAVMASSGYAAASPWTLMPLSILLWVTVEESVFWLYWHQYIVTIWVTRQPTDRWGCSIYNACTPLPSTLGGRGRTPHAESTRGHWYLAVTRYVPQIVLCKCPHIPVATSGTDNILCSAGSRHRTSHGSRRERSHHQCVNMHRPSQRKATKSVGCC